MTQQKSTDRGANRGSTSKPRTTNPNTNSKTSPEKQPEPQFPIKPEFWDALLDSIPPWGDEIAAIMLIVFGVVSFLSLLDVSSDAVVAQAWSNALTSLFGYGSIVVSAGILGLGIVILLPKMGIVVKFPTRRVLALEVAFLCTLAILHLSTGDAELRAVARAGRGGGQIGWAVSFAIAGLLGTTVALVVYSSLLIVSLFVASGIRRADLKRWLQGGSQGLRQFGERVGQVTESERQRKRRLASSAGTASSPGQTSTTPSTSARKLPAGALVRVRPKRDHLPPSLRPGATTGVTTTSEPAPASPPASPPTFSSTGKTGPLILKDAPADGDKKDPALLSSDLKSSFNAIGQLKGKKTKGVQLVERPDGRVKRYFSIESMKEPKRVGKRDASLPPLDLLRDIELNVPDENEINTNVVLIENTLLEFDIDVDVVDVKVGPTVTQYAVQPFKETRTEDGEAAIQRTRLSRIAALSGDLALSLSAKRLRLEIPVPGHSYMGIEVPNRNPSVVALRSVYESRYYYEETLKNRSPLFIPLGRDVSGMPVSVDVAQLPHLLISGTTGSGKSVCIAAITAALVMNNTPDKIKLVMLDPKLVELSRFNGLPHLLGPVETDQERIIGVLRWCTREMDRRYKLLQEHDARNIAVFNSRLGQRRKEEYLPYIVILVDEIGDLMMSRPEETEKTVTRLAQMARAVGMHLIVATQRPSVDVITGLIKANFPARIAFAVASGVDSRVILDSVGAETLLGKGDMLYLAPDAAAPRRLQGCYVSDDEVRKLVTHWRDWHQKQVEKGKAELITIGPWERGLTRRESLSEADPMLEAAIQLVIAEGEASASLIQRRLGLGYPRAARIMDLLEELGIVGELMSGGRSRRVLIQPGKDPFKELFEKKPGGKK